MKLTILFGIGLLALSSMGEEISPVPKALTNGWVVSSVQSNVFAVFTTLKGGAEFASEAPIRFGFMDTGATFVIDVPRPEYGIRISAVTDTGKPIPKTRIGKEYGGLWSEFTTRDKKFFETDIRVRRLPRVLITSSTLPALANLPPPKELFEFPGPGKYTMIVELKFFAHPIGAPIGSVPNAPVIKLPPVKLNVTHSSAAPPEHQGFIAFCRALFDSFPMQIYSLLVAVSALVVAALTWRARLRNRSAHRSNCSAQA